MNSAQVQEWAARRWKNGGNNYKFLLPSTQRANLIEMSVILRMTAPDVCRMALNLLYESLKKSEDKY